MKYKSLSSQATYQKDIGTFYGVNRTNKINDYQMSDCFNMDTVSFPHFSTRGKRELFYDEHKMAVLCSDTDITDDYAVTGVTADGGFVYRGEKVLENQLRPDCRVVEFFGDYVFLPFGYVVTVSAGLDDNGALVHEASLSGFPAGTEFSSGLDGNISATSVDRYYCMYITKDTIHYNYSYSQRSGFSAFGSYATRMSVGSLFKLKLFSAKGKYESYVADGDEFYVCDIPDDVYMTVDDVYGELGDGTRVSRDEIKCGYYDEEESTPRIVIEFTARDGNGNLYDISQHFCCFEDYNEAVLVKCDTYITGLTDRGLPSGPDYFNDCYIRPMEVSASLGLGFGGRFFVCDNLGVEIRYTSGSMDADKKYDFAPGTELGGAGFVSCGDPGKWTALCAYGNALYAFKKDRMYRIYSPDGLSFYMERVADVGTFSDKSVCVVSEVMYFLSETGLYRFTGTYPEELPDNYGRKYTGGVLGGVDNKLYCSVTSADGDELLVYDAEVNAYGVHDNFCSEGFVTYGGKLYALDKADGHVYEITDKRDSVEFSFDTRKFFLGFDKKAINGVRLYFDFSGGEGDYFEVLVSYDGGEFEPCFTPVTNGKLKYIPIKFKKCDELVLRVRGRGVFTLKGMSLSMYSGGNIKQNR